MHKIPHHIPEFAAMPRILAVLIGALATFTTPALAQPRDEIVVGYVVSATGSNASLGVHYRNAEQLFPTEIAGTKVRYIVRDDASDSTQALNIVRQLIAEDHVDAVIGPSLTTSALAVIQLMNDDHVPEIATSPFPLDPKTYPWTFSLVQTGGLMMQGVAAHMQAHGIHRIGFIGFSDSFGDQILQGIQAQAATAGLSITSEQRYARSDTSVQAQVLRVMATHPDAVLIGASGTQAALPGITLRERGFTGPIYSTHGAVNQDFLRVGGASVEGEIAPTGPVSVYDQLPDSNASKAVGTTFMTRYLAAFGAQNRNAFAGYAWDGYLVFASAAATALKTTKPGTAEFRTALRNAIETDPPIVGTHGTIKMSLTDHYGHDSTGLVMVVVKDGSWQLVN
jgi:branched-chain amino acid transport system substrate-binding protein